MRLKFWAKPTPPEIPPREALARHLADALLALPDTQIIRFYPQEEGPLGGLSTKITAVHRGVFVTVNVYGRFSEDE